MSVSDAHVSCNALLNEAARRAGPETEVLVSGVLLQESGGLEHATQDEASEFDILWQKLAGRSKS